MDRIDELFERVCSLSKPAPLVEGDPKLPEHGQPIDPAQAQFLADFQADLLDRIRQFFEFDVEAFASNAAVASVRKALQKFASDWREKPLTPDGISNFQSNLNDHNKRLNIIEEFASSADSNNGLNSTVKKDGSNSTVKKNEAQLARDQATIGAIEDARRTLNYLLYMIEKYFEKLPLVERGIDEPYRNVLRSAVLFASAPE